MSQSSVAVPISTHLSDAERAVRIDLAACYRLVALYGWDDLDDRFHESCQLS